MRLPRYLALLAFILLAIDEGGAAAQSPDAPIRQKLDSVGSLLIPDSMDLIKDPKPYPDFVIYNVQMKITQERILGAYIGNAANVQVDETTYIDNCIARTSTRRDVGARSRVDRDTLIVFEARDRSTTLHFPKMLHFFYRDLTDDIARQANSIIQSFQPTEGLKCILLDAKQEKVP